MLFILYIDRGKWSRSSSIHKFIARGRGAFSGVKNTNEMDSISVYIFIIIYL